MAYAEPSWAKKLRTAAGPPAHAKPTPYRPTSVAKGPRAPLLPPPQWQRLPPATAHNPYVNGGGFLDEDVQQAQDPNTSSRNIRREKSGNVSLCKFLLQNLQAEDDATDSTSSFQRVFIDAADFIPDETDNSIEMLREELQVSVEGVAADAYPPVTAFNELDILPDYLLKALSSMDRERTLPVQAQALPIILGGHDIIGIAKTGSGKTLAFLIPAIVHIEAQPPLRMDVASPIALVLAPTRELAQQIADEAGKLLEYSAEGRQSRGTQKGIWAQEIYGGKQRQEQLKRSKGCAIVVATPGRLTDFVQNQELFLDRVTYFVLDEADRMLDYGFQDDVNNFASSIRPDRQMLFFSATWPKAVEELATSLCQNSQQPAIIRVGQRSEDAPASRADIVQDVVVFDQETWEERDSEKKKMLYDHLRIILPNEEHKILVFVSNKTLADELRDTLGEEGFATESMHGGRKQYDRDDALNRFKNGEIRLLVATDVMGRGLDIPTISHVVIYDMGDVDDYIHRIGRTARGLTERPGHALTLFEYNQKWPELAEGLMKVLEDSEQPVPEDLRRIAEEVENGQRTIVERSFGNKKGKKDRKKRNWDEAELDNDWKNGEAGNGGSKRDWWKSW